MWCHEQMSNYFGSPTNVHYFILFFKKKKKKKTSVQQAINHRMDVINWLKSLFVL
jgi:hypothetical protein